MPDIRMIVKQGADQDLTVDRVPVARDYITPDGRNLVRVVAVVFTPKNPSFAAFVYAEKDPDDKPDELDGANFQ